MGSRPARSFSTSRRTRPTRTRTATGSRTRTRSSSRSTTRSSPARDLIARPGPGRAQIGEDRRDAAVLTFDLTQAELEEYLADVRLDRLLRHDEALGDRAIRPALGHQRQHLAL